MAGLQRMVKSGICLYNYRSHDIISPINRLGTPVNFHRSLCSSSRGDGRSDLPNVKWFDNHDTFVRSVALRAEGIPVTESQVLAEYLKELPEFKFNSLLKDIRRVRSFEKESELRKRNKRDNKGVWFALGFGCFMLCSPMAFTIYMDFTLWSNSFFSQLRSIIGSYCNSIFLLLLLMTSIFSAQPAM